ncbi:hypothetical protein Cal7507_3252 [Calothrix sp. PCC 7507]|nr:hypothetical protein Cal7507_3252 [Calothrix sp. PCC 7507]
MRATYLCLLLGNFNSYSVKRFKSPIKLVEGVSGLFYLLQCACSLITGHCLLNLTTPLKKIPPLSSGHRATTLLNYNLLFPNFIYLGDHKQLCYFVN